MIEVRKFADLGARDHGWLNTHHHFSFDSYHDLKRMGWGTLRVLNDDLIAPGEGFPFHTHRDMEIITYVREGAISHKDSRGNEGRTVAGDVQVMSAGSGIRHSEYNHEKEWTSIFQIWIIPSEADVTPGWATRPFPKGGRANRLVPLASGMRDEGALPIHAPARVLGATIDEGRAVRHHFAPGRLGYLVSTRGEVLVNGVPAEARDGVAICKVEEMEIFTPCGAEVILVDVPRLEI